MRPQSGLGTTAIILLAGATILASSLSPKIMGSATNEIVRGAQSLLGRRQRRGFRPAGPHPHAADGSRCCHIAAALCPELCDGRREPAHHVATCVRPWTASCPGCRWNTMIPMPMAIFSPVSPTMWTPFPIRCNPALFRRSGRGTVGGHHPGDDAHHQPPPDPHRPGDSPHHIVVLLHRGEKDP